MELAEWCAQLSKTSADAAEWVNRNPETVRNEREGLLKELRRAGRQFRACGRAASRKMCAGVFGPSQVGKSYLISALASGPDGQLNAVLGDKTYDFLSEINPEGGKESTGLVTRFTLTKDSGPSDHPVQIAMLSETGLVKIIANTYFADSEPKDAPAGGIEEVLQELESQANGASRIDIDAMEDLHEYIASNFRARAQAQELERAYWERAIELAPKLDLQGRIRLYSLIWDQVEEFTGLLARLLTALDSLGYPEICHCSLDALIPRANSIIDVATLAGLEQEQTGPAIEVIAPSGRKSSLAPAIVAALAAELTIVIAEKPAEYFEHTDLLDFPGYRSRYKLENVSAELKKPGMLKELFLRGKVAYLFQRYCSQRELNSMLLCIGPSNQEVQDLPGVINDWIRSTHGATPEERIDRKTSLFLVLTKFDMEFEDKKGAPSLEGRWDNRLHASLLDFFGKQHEWPAQWTPGKPFNNVFLLRNPNYRFEAVMDFDGDRETGIRPQRAEYVRKLEQAFMNSQLVHRHFADPGRAWEEGMRLNDGGISWLRESLSPLCDPEIKRQQLLQSVDSTREGIIRRLQGFHQTDDHEELRKQKLALIQSLFRDMGALETQKHRLGQLMRMFTIDETELFSLHSGAMRRMHEKKRLQLPAQEQIESDLENLDLGSLNPFSQPAPADEEQDDEASAFAEAIENKWVEKLHALAGDDSMRSFFMLKPREFSELASELATGAERIGLRKRLAREFRHAAAYSNTSKGSIARRQAAIAAATLNHYIDWLGFDPYRQTDRERTIPLPGSTQPVVFTPREPQDKLPSLSETPGQYTGKWFQDWLYALAGLILENVNFDGAHTFNVAENTALGAILGRLEKSEQKAA